MERKVIILEDSEDQSEELWACEEVGEQVRNEKKEKSVGESFKITINEITESDSTQNRFQGKDANNCYVSLKLVNICCQEFQRCKKKYYENCQSQKCLECKGSNLKKVVENQQELPLFSSLSPKLSIETPFTIINMKVNRESQPFTIIKQKQRNLQDKDQKTSQAISTKKSRKRQKIQRKKQLLNQQITKHISKTTKNKIKQVLPSGRSIINFFPPSFSVDLTDAQFEQKNRQDLLVKVSDYFYDSGILNGKEGEAKNEDVSYAKNMLELYEFIYSHPLFVRRYKYQTYIMFPIPDKLLYSKKYTFFNFLIKDFHQHSLQIQNYSDELPDSFSVIFKIWSYGHILGTENIHNLSLASLQKWIKSPQKFILILQDILMIYFQEIQHLQHNHKWNKKDHRHPNKKQLQREQLLSNKYNNLPEIIKILSFISSIGHLHEILFYFWPLITKWMLTICYFRTVKQQKNKSNFYSQELNSAQFTKLLIRLHHCQMQEGKMIAPEINIEDKFAILGILVEYIDGFSIIHQKLRHQSLKRSQNKYPSNQAQIASYKSRIALFQQKLVLITAQQAALSSQITQFQHQFTNKILADSQQNNKIFQNLVSQKLLLQSEIIFLRKKLVEVKNCCYQSIRQHFWMRKDDSEFITDFISLNSLRMVFLGKDHEGKEYYYADGHPDRIYAVNGTKWREIKYKNIQKLTQALTSKSFSQNLLLKKISTLLKIGLLTQIQYSYRCICQQEHQIPHRDPQISRKISKNIKQTSIWVNISRMMFDCLEKIEKDFVQIRGKWVKKLMKRDILKCRFGFRGKFIQKSQKMMNKFVALLQEFVHQIDSEGKRAGLPNMKVWPSRNLNRSWNKSLCSLGQQFQESYYNIQKRNELSQLIPVFNSDFQLQQKQIQLNLLMTILFIRINHTSKQQSHLFCPKYQKQEIIMIESQCSEASQGVSSNQSQCSSLEYN